jgi:hypothetical protein
MEIRKFSFPSPVSRRRRQKKVRLYLNKYIAGAKIPRRKRRRDEDATTRPGEAPLAIVYCLLRPKLHYIIHGPPEVLYRW